MVNAVIYARFSSHKQREESIEGQIRKCREYAEKNNINIIEEYIDRAKTGREFVSRENAMRLVEDSKKKNFSVVLMYKLDRFAREPADFYFFQRELEKNGVKIEPVEEQIGEGSQATLMIGIYTALNAYYSKELGEKVNRGMTENALKGTYNGSYRTFGYDIIEKRYVVNEDESVVVKKIFEKYSKGDTIRSIIDWCNERGYKTPQYKDFDYSFIDRLLKNQKYIGVLKWNGILYEDGITPIVEKDVFDKVQKRLKENSNTGARAKAVEPYVLVGKAFCGLCEQPLVADSVKKPIKVKKEEYSSHRSTYTIPSIKNINAVISGSSYTTNEEKEYKIYRYYTCRGKKQAKYKNGCTKQRMDKDVLENAVISYTANQYLIDENLKDMARAIYKVQQKSQADPNIQNIENKIAEEQLKITNLLNLFEKGIQDENTTERYSQAKTRKADLEKELNEIKSSTPTMTEQSIYSKLLAIKKKMLGYIKKGEIPLEVKKVFCDTFISKVFVFDEDGTGDDDTDKKIKIKIVFDAFESDGLLGFDDAEIELCSISEVIGSPQKRLAMASLFSFVFEEHNIV